MLEGEEDFETCRVTSRLFQAGGLEGQGHDSGGRWEGLSEEPLGHTLKRALLKSASHHGDDSTEAGTSPSVALWGNLGSGPPAGESGPKRQTPRNSADRLSPRGPEAGSGTY